MKADLYRAQARTAGRGGIAHRTAAGFVVLTSADGSELIDLITTKQIEPDLVDQIVAYAQDRGPQAFAMLFTADGDPYLIASGSATASISSLSSQLSLSPAPGQVLVHPLNAGINETTAFIRLRTSAEERAEAINGAFQAGTVEAEWVEVAIGGATIDIGSHSSLRASDVSADTISAENQAEAIPASGGNQHEGEDAKEAAVTAVEAEALGNVHTEGPAAHVGSGPRVSLRTDLPAVRMCTSLFRAGKVVKVRATRRVAETSLRNTVRRGVRASRNRG